MAAQPREKFLAQGTGLRNACYSFVPFDSVAWMKTYAGDAVPAAGAVVANASFTNGKMPYPRSLAVKMTTAGTGSDHDLKIEFYGVNQFDEPVVTSVEFIDIGANESAGIFRHTAKVFARCDAFKVVSKGGLGADDTIDIGLSSQATAVDFGLPFRIDSASDILCALNNGATAIAASQMTVDAVEAKVKFTAVITNGQRIDLWVRTRLLGK